MLREALFASAASLVFATSAVAAVDPLKPATDALVAALRAAKPGDVVKAGPGPYATLNVPATAAGVTLTSADPSHPASFAGININGQTGLTVSHVEVTGRVAVGNAKQITLDSLSVHDFPGGIAVMFRNDQDVSLTRSDIHDVNLAVAIIDSQGVTISGNTIRRMTSDAIDSFGSGKVAITGNKISDITELDNGHPDGIQFAPSSQKVPPYPTDDILVDGNDLRTGDGAAFQGIFGGGSIPASPYTNVRITNNLVMSDMYNGIALIGMVDPVISGNYVQSHAGVVDTHGAAMGPSIMLRASQGGTIADNVSPKVSIVAPIGPSPAVKHNRAPKLAPNGAYEEADAWRASKAADAGKAVSAAH